MNAHSRPYSAYGKTIMEATGCAPEETHAIEEVMRCSFPTLDHLTKKEITKLAIDAQRVLDVEDVGVMFKTKDSGTTPCWYLVIQHPPGKKPVKLLAELEKVGWKPEPRQILWYPKGAKYHEVIVGRPGSAIFERWTPEESKKYMREVQKVLRAFGFARVPKCKLTMQDML